MKQKIRWLHSGWDHKGTARELWRLANAWQFTGSGSRDEERRKKDTLGHYATGSVLQFTRFNILMRISEQMRPVKVKLLAVRFVDTISLKPKPIDIIAALSWAEAVFGDDSVKTVTSETRGDSGEPVYMWKLFCNDRWEAQDPPEEFKSKDLLTERIERIKLEWQQKPQ